METVFRWSPQPQQALYPFPGKHRMIRLGPDAWNLAWLSHPFEQRLPPNQPEFDEAVARTLRERVATHGDKLYVYSLLAMPPMSFALAVGGSPDFQALTIVKYLGITPETWRLRALEARQDHPRALERMLHYDTGDNAAAKVILKRYQLQ